MIGPIAQVSAEWQLGAVHSIESEDVVNAVVRFASGATGIIQASTAIWPGYTERIEIHGTDGSAILAGGRLVTWDVRNDSGVPAPLDIQAASGASDPMAISVVPLERQFLDFADAIKLGRTPLELFLRGGLVWRDVRQSPCIQHVANARYNILPTVELVGHGTVVEHIPASGMP